MRDPDRMGPLLAAVLSIWQKHPDLRLCQLLTAAAFKAGWNDNDLFYLEDDLLLKGVKEMEQE